MANELGADSLRYLPVESIARAVEKPASQICQACITGQYPTPHGQQLYDIALANDQASGSQSGVERTSEAAVGEAAVGEAT